MNIKKTLLNFLKMILVTKQMRKMTKTIFFQNDPDEEKSDSEENQEQLSKNDKSDVEFGSDDNMEEGFPVENAYKGEEYEMEEEGEGEDNAQDEGKDEEGVDEDNTEDDDDMANDSKLEEEESNTEETEDKENEEDEDNHNDDTTSSGELFKKILITCHC